MPKRVRPDRQEDGDADSAGPVGSSTGLPWDASAGASASSTVDTSSGGGASQGSGRGRGLAGSGRGSGRGALVTARFKPGGGGSSGGGKAPASATAPAAQKMPKTAAGASSAAAAAEEESATVEVKSSFARIFKGGAKRREAGFEGEFLKEEEEGVEEVPEPLELTTPQTGATLSWLTSLGADSAAVVEEADAADEAPAAVDVSSVDVTSLELGWLGSIGGGPGKAKAAAISTVASVASGGVWTPSLSAAAEAYVGKPLPIPPLWSTAPRHVLKKELMRDRPILLSRMRRMSRDAKRMAESRKSGAKPKI
eukprot:TRINITY_DN76023_c0_g1_i1.p1 TRINITY_DN76023_c0_g1~~TRINITY_DN76023_c0_g1_i1.p1  ORF type:complete len:310 (+),score=76.09 TRINITY_DN76023_c0_g1_i1:82-1011(+)